MGKEEILNYLKNAKIEDKTLGKICYYFSKDFTASQTAQELNLSRQTINNYYKIIRNLLLQSQNELMLFMKENNFCQNSFSIKYIKSGKNMSYFIECNEKVFIIDSSNPFLPNMSNFIEKHLDDSLLKNRVANCAKVLYIQKEEKFLITKLHKSENKMQSFVDSRLKKFRGLNKDTLKLHLLESQFRYNYSAKFLYETLLKLLNLNTKTSSLISI